MEPLDPLKRWLTGSMNPLDSAEVIRQEMFTGTQVAGNLEGGHLTQKA